MWSTPEDRRRQLERIKGTNKVNDAIAKVKAERQPRFDRVLGEQFENTQGDQ